MRTWEEVRQESLQADAEEAAEYIRVALEENDVQMLAYALRNVRAARGSLDDLNLSRAELLAIVDALSHQSIQSPRAAYPATPSALSPAVLEQRQKAGARQGQKQRAG